VEVSIGQGSSTELRDSLIGRLRLDLGEVEVRLGAHGKWSCGEIGEVGLSDFMKRSYDFSLLFC